MRFGTGGARGAKPIKSMASYGERGMTLWRSGNSTNRSVSCPPRDKNVNAFGSADRLYVSAVVCDAKISGQWGSSPRERNKCPVSATAGSHALRLSPGTLATLVHTELPDHKRANLLYKIQRQTPNYPRGEILHIISRLSPPFLTFLIISRW